jgi:hypothetical protein
LLFYEPLTVDHQAEIFQLKTINSFKRTFCYYLSLWLVKELHLTHLAITFKNKREIFAMKRLRNVLEDKDPNQAALN